MANTTLSILVTGRDEGASATLDKVAANGKRVGTSLSTAGARSSTALRGVAQSGQSVATSMATTGRSASTSFSKVESGAAKFKSTLKDVGKFVGIAFAATEVYQFGKASLHAFEDVEREQRLMESGLDRIGASRVYPQLVEDLKGVSSETVSLQEDTFKLGAAILNIGHDFFQSLGPEGAEGAVAGLTKGLENISAATHKPISMLTRSLTFALVNTPEKAIGLLQKFGVASRQQADRWKEMAKEGQFAALQMEEVQAVTDAYPHAANRAATAQDRMNKTLDDMKIFIGEILHPLSRVAERVLHFVFVNRKLALSLGAVFLAAKYVPKVIDLITASMLRLETVAAAGGLGALLAKAAAYLPDVAAGLPMIAGGIAEVSDKLHNFKTSTAALRNAVSSLTPAQRKLYDEIVKSNAALQTTPGRLAASSIAWSMAGGTAYGMAKQVQFANQVLHDNGISARLNADSLGNLAEGYAVVGLDGGAFNDRLLDLNRRFDSGKLSVAQYDRAINDLDGRYGKMYHSTLTASKAQAVLARATGQTMAEVQTGTALAQRSVHRFANLGKKDFAKWAHEAKQSASEAIGALGGVELATRKTAHGFLHDSHMMAKAAKQDAAAIRRLGQASQGWVPDAYKKWLIDQGPQAVANFEQLTGKAQRQAVADWKTAQRGSDAYARSIQRLGNTGPIDKASGHLQKLSDTLERIAQQSPAYIDVYIREHGSIPKTPGHAAGTAQRMPKLRGYASGSGYLSTPEIARVGEHGPEIVELPAGAKVWPHGTSPATHSGAVVRTGSSASRSAATDVHVRVALDRRRFAREMDYEVTYRGA